MCTNFESVSVPRDRGAAESHSSNTRPRRSQTVSSFANMVLCFVCAAATGGFVFAPAVGEEYELKWLVVRASGIDPTTDDTTIIAGIEATMTSKLSAAPYNFDFEMMRSNVTSALANESFAGGEQAADYSRQIADDSLTGYYLYLPNSGIYTPNGNQHEGVVPVKPNNSVQQVRLSNLVVNGTAYSANVNFRIVVEKK